MFEKLLCFLPWTCSNGFNSWISLTMHVVFILRWSPDSMLSWDFVHTCMLIYQIVPQWSLYHQSPCMLCLWNELFCLHTSVERSLYWGDCIFSGPNHLQCFFPWPPFQLVKNPHLNSSAPTRQHYLHLGNGIKHLNCIFTVLAKWLENG